MERVRKNRPENYRRDGGLNSLAKIQTNGQTKRDSLGRGKGRACSELMTALIRNECSPSFPLEPSSQVRRKSVQQIINAEINKPMNK